MEPAKTFKYRKVMVVDDSDIDRYIAKQIIKRSGFAEEVILEDSATDALQYLQALDDADNVPRIVFLDIRLPEMDGFEFLDRFEKLPDVVRDNCSVAMTSSSVDQEDHDKAMKSKYVRCFIDKPLSQENLRKEFY
jgi:CheY-like chemotaxis protein